MDQLFALDSTELQYRELYRKAPKAYQTTVRSWEEFRERFHEPIMPRPPTFISAVLSEEDFFSVGDVTCFRNQRFCPPFMHKLEFIKIIYALRGKALFYFADRTYVIQEGQFCIVAPGIEQAVLSPDEEDVTVNILMRSTTFTDTFSNLLKEQDIVSGFFWKMAYTKYSNRILCYRGGRESALHSIVMSLLNEAERAEKTGSLVMKSYVSIFLGEVIRRYNGRVIFLDNEGEMSDAPAILKDIRENLKFASLKWLAAKWGLSQQDMNYALKTEVGYSFNYILNDLRLKTAAQMLLRTSLSVEAIIEEIGHNDHTLFYQKFKKRYGVTPQVYRQNGNISLHY